MQKESNWYKNEEDLAPRPNNPYTQLYVMYRALYECSTSHSGTVKDVAFMLGCIEASGEMPAGIRPIRLDKHGNSASDMTARLRDLFYRGYVRRDAPVDEVNPTERLNYNMPYTKTVQLERAVWRIATREEFEEVAAIYIKKSMARDKKYRDSRKGAKKEVVRLVQGAKDFAEHATDLSSQRQAAEKEFLDKKLAYERARYKNKTKETLKAQALEEVKAEIKASQVKALRYVLTFGAGAGIALILTLLGKLL